MKNEKFATIAHCAISFIHLHNDWSNKMIADEVKRIMGSNTGPGNISWYKGKLKKGEMKVADYIVLDKAIESVSIKEVVVVDPIIDILPELIVTEEDIIKAKGLQKIALEFYKNRTEYNFGKLYSRLKPGMVYHAMGILKDVDAAEDVVSIAFTKIWTKIEQYNKFWNFSTWAYRIIHNEAMQYIRKTKSIVRMDGNSHAHDKNGVSIMFDEYNLIKKGAPEELIFTDPDWELKEYQTDTQQVVHQKVLNEINNLSKFYKDIMIDRELEGLKYKEIADKYNININSVKTRIKRARMQIVENNPEYSKIVKSRNKSRNSKNSCVNF